MLSDFEGARDELARIEEALGEQRQWLLAQQERGEHLWRTCQESWWALQAQLSAVRECLAVQEDALARLRQRMDKPDQ